MDLPPYALVQGSVRSLGVVALVVVEHVDPLFEIADLHNFTLDPAIPFHQRRVSGRQVQKPTADPARRAGVHPPEQIRMAAGLSQRAVYEDAVHRLGRMIHVLVGQRADALFEALPSPNRGVLQSWHWVVADASLTAWLKQRATLRFGVAAGWRVHGTFGFWADRVERNLGLRLLDVPTLERAVLGALLTEPPPAALPFLDGAASEAERERRAFQLATRLARWVHGTRWNRGRIPQGDLAEWTAEQPTDAVWLDQAVDRPGFGGLDGPVTFWDGLNHSQVVLRALERLVGARTVVATNPCVEFWEDLPQRRAGFIDRSAAPAASTQPGLFPEADENALLVQWGAAGRAPVAALNQLADGDLESVFAEPDPSSQLGRLQTDVLLRRAPRKLRSDPSLRIVHAASPRAEAEALVQALADHPAPLNQVSVGWPGSDPVIRAHVVAALEQAGLPFAELDVRLEAVSGVLELFSLLLSIPSSGFRGEALMQLLLHPNLACDLEPEEREVCVGWLQALPVVDGADRRDHRDTYIESDVLNWEQGLRRLSLGLLHPQGTRVSVGAHTYVAHEPGSQELGSRAIGMLRELLVGLSSLRGSASPDVWARRWTALCSRWIRCEREDDERDLMRLYDVLGDLQGARPWSHRVLTLWLERALQRLSTRRGAPWTGLTLGPLHAVARIPATARFLVGLTDDAFPSRDPTTDWHPEGQPGREDQDRFAFLQSVMNTTERLHLSYSGVHTPPSPVLLELLAHFDADPSEDREPLALGEVLPPPPPRSRRASTSLWLEDLVTFFIDPYEGWKSAWLGHSRTAVKPEEPFQWNPTSADRSLTEALVRTWPDPVLPEDALPPPGTAGVPAGAFHRVDQERLIETFARWQRSLIEAGVPAEPLRSEAPTSVELAPRPGLRVELSVPGAVWSPHAPREHVVWPSVRDRVDRHRFQVRAALVHLIRNLTSPAATAGICVDRRGRTLFRAHRALPPEAARDLLEKWCLSLLEETHAYTLPHAAATGLAELLQHGAGPDELRRRHARFVAAYGDVDPPLLELDGALKVVRARWLPLLELTEAA